MNPSILDTLTPMVLAGEISLLEVAEILAIPDPFEDGNGY